jgi:hypothetical protein
MNFDALAVAALALAFLVMVLAGCSRLKVEGECEYKRTITTTYQCQPGGNMEHNRLAPGGGPPEP